MSSYKIEAQFYWSKKDALCEIPVKCNLSTEVSRLIILFKACFKSFYKYKYYLTKDEAIENDPGLSEFKTTYLNQSRDIRKPTVAKMFSEAAELTPHTKKDWIGYEQWTCAAKFKRKIIQQGQEANLALYNKPNKTNLFLHYDTTSRSQIDGVTGQPWL